MGGPNDGDDPRSINIPKTEGSQNVTAPKISMYQMNQPLKIMKVNIGTEEQLKFTNVGDYWDEEMMAKIIDLLHEFQDLFPTKFFEMKGILGYLGEMKIPLKPYVNLVKQWSYRLNPR